MMTQALELHAAKMRTRKDQRRNRRIGQPRMLIGPIGRIHRAVRDRFGYEFVVRSRTPAIVLARQVAMYLTKRLLPWASYGLIAMHFGGMHHTTVMASVRVIDEERTKDANLAKLLTELETDLAWSSINEPRSGTGNMRRVLIAEIVARGKCG